MNEIKKGLIFDGKARVAIIDIKDIVNEEIRLHDLSPLAAAALGRAMTAGEYISSNLKDSDASFSLTLNGGGELGAVVVAGQSGNFIRGYVANPHVELPPKADGHFDMGGGIGKNGFITVIKDIGLKEPYVGRCELVSGEVAEDFAQYLYTSEGVKSAVALGVRVDKNGCVGAGGVIVEALPGINEGELFMLEDIMKNFGNVSETLAEKSAEEIFSFYFSHLGAEEYESERISLKCNCGEEKIKATLKSIGKKECDEILKEVGRIEVKCQFCEKKYTYTAEEANKLWE
jgi:molecular chaperone Hsp33